ncbi:MAG: hypothetical protein K8S98_11105 [Planctomycetes bacterium]|nr:hypothetical protein [Planctomycetota bacterium]
MRRTSSSASRARAALLAVFVLAASAAAQDAPTTQELPPTTAQRRPSSHDESVLRERNRERLHPGDPLALGGSAGTANDAHDDSPASDRVIAYVDQTEAYRRKLAMYEEHAHFTSPVTRDYAAERKADPAAAPAVRAVKPAEVAVPTKSWAPLWFGLGAILCALIVRRVSPRIDARAAHNAQRSAS